VKKMKNIGFWIGIILGGIMGFLPINGLTAQGQTILAIFVVSAAWWAWNVLPAWATGMAMMASWAVFAGVPAELILSPFGSDIMWFILATLVLSSAMTRTGLADRLGLMLLKFLPGNTFWIVFSFFSAAVILSPGIPANTVQALVMAPIALAILEQSGLKPKSPEAAYIGLGFMTAVSTLSGVLPTSGVHSLIIASLLPAWYNWSWASWLARSLPVAALTVGGMLLLIGPVLGASIQRIPKDAILRELQKKGFILKSKKEIILLMLFAGTLVFVFTRGIHNIPYTALGLVLILFIFLSRIFDEKEIFTSVDWGLWIWIGSITAIGSVFPKYHLDRWIFSLIEPTLAAVLEISPVLFVALLAVSCYAVRFFITSWVAFAAVAFTALLPAVVSMGIDPLVLGLILLMAMNPFFFPFQNAACAVCEGLQKEKWWSAGQRYRVAAIWCVINLAALTLGTYYWIWGGFFFLR
jgi:sodium-dependent dicarboxylate transporter 2/3/5